MSRSGEGQQYSFFAHHGDGSFCKYYFKNFYGCISSALTAPLERVVFINFT